MKVLVTGGAGFIGSNIAYSLLEKGHHVIVIDNFLSSSFENLVDLNTDLISADLADFDLKCLPKLGGIFHQQAITDTTILDQNRMLNQNVETFRKLLRYTISKKIPLIYASSAGVYGNVPPPQREEGILNPLNVYGFSKLQMDRLARFAYAESKSPIVGLRYFNVFGPRERYKNKAASMIYQLAEQMRAGRRPRIFEFGDQERDHIYVKDVVHANLCAWNSDAKTVCNVGTGKSTSFNRLIEIINGVLGTKFEPEYFKNPYSFYQNHTRADIQKAARDIGYKPQWSIEKGIEDYLKTIYQLNSKVKSSNKPKVKIFS